MPATSTEREFCRSRPSSWQGIGKGVLFGFLFALSASCYRPTYDGPYRCDPQNGDSDCPDGWTCSYGLCVAPGQTPPQNGICSGPGTLLAMARGEQVWACTGSFAAGTASSLCAAQSDVHVCGPGPHDEALLALVDCDAVQGFYLSLGSLAVGPSPICDPPPGPPRVLLGCGTGPSVVRIPGADCHGLHHSIGCFGSVGWSCDPQKGGPSAAHTYSQSSPGGVLCCSGAAMPRR